MFYHQLYLVLLLVLVTININSLALTIDQKSNTVHLEAPNLSGQYHNNRPSLQFSSNVNKIELISKADVINPCNGTFIKTNGTTCGLKEIMLGRCYQYQYIQRGLYLSNTTAVKNCTELYELFESEVRFKPYCNMNMSTYEKYFQRALEGVHVINRAIFWSGTYAITHTYSAHGHNYITLEDTLAANMLDGLMWCGKENDPQGFDYVSCPNNCQDNRWADLAFWGLASKTFAERVAGEIYVVLNGSRTDGRPSYRNGSYFAEFELPNFQRTGPYRVTKINILVLHTPDLPVVERCGEKSIIHLEHLIRDAQFEYICIDDPDELLLIMCGDSWGARECEVARTALRRAWDLKVLGKSNANYYPLSLLLLFFTGIFRQMLSN
ncbi:unnamed protein product [Adineta steineri]|uniref:ADP-ribosyl cyclase/cyclic ADP-ribose hydrolase n=1 Tax=Adineta steineri TaxID=433720 RepID=A0A818NDS0_9BILA|nr:unnamed protein product [Adineta steineri]CAF3603154.1 unnamed protein product [Adineta steineri]